MFRLANNLGLYGYVRNVGGSEVEVHVEGFEDSLNKFIKMLRDGLPPIARIDELSIYEVGVVGFKDFKIISSSAEAIKYSMIPPDIGICDECIKEVLDVRDRRYRYPFNSCVWCGPRFSMMYRSPYDRVNTSMNDFPLCSDCLSEYEDPNNIRRFHAQGISCPRCGPKAILYTSSGELVDYADPIAEAGKLVSEGYVVGVKGLGGYHIAALATDDDVVIKLRLRKGRPQKPFAIMALDESVVSKLCYLSSEALKILKSPERPIVLLPKKEGSPVSKYVSPGLDVEGVFLPYTALHYLLLDAVRDRFSIMTSGNPGGKPMCVDEECAFKLLKDYVDYFLIHNRVIVNRVDDSVVRFTNGRPVLLRRGRGYTPQWIKTKFKFKKPVIAFGAELQSAGAIAFDDKVILTQYVGDVDDYDVLNDLDRYLSWFIRTYNIDVGKSYLVVDKHPNYTSRVLAEDYLRRCGGELVEVQHHYAHALATAADLGLDPNEEFIAVVLDGVGYGDDGNVWGGEVIRGDYICYSRVGHLERVILPDTDYSTRYPVRVLTSFLYKILRDDEEVVKLISKLGLVEVFRYGVDEAYIVLKKVRSSKVLTSSTGRFLDSVSVLLKVCFERTYEGEPAIKLEAVGSKGKLLDGFEGFVGVSGGVYEVLTTKIIEKVLENLDRSVSDLAYSTQYSLGMSLGEIVRKLIYGTKTNYVILGGGAVVNSIIVKGLEDFLRSYDIKVYLPRRIPPNDGGIAVGQVVSTYWFNNS